MKTQPLRLEHCTTAFNKALSSLIQNMEAGSGSLKPKPSLAFSPLHMYALLLDQELQ